MILVLLGILGSLIPLAIMVGIVVLIIRFVSGRDKASSEGVGILLRRFFVYSIMLVMLVLVGIGVAGLIQAAWPGFDQLSDSSSQTAISIAFVVVGLPVFSGLALYTRSRLSEDPKEQRSMGWAFYVTVALIGSLLASMSLIGAVLSDLASDGDIDRTLLIHAVTWTAIWAGHWWVSQKWKPERNTQFHVLLGSAIGLIWAFAGTFATIAAVLSTVYDDLFLVSIVDGGISDLLVPMTVVLVGGPAWWWHWFRHARHGPRTAWWLAHVLLLGVLGGAVTVIVGTGVMLFGVLDWILGEPDTSAAAHFTFLPGAITGVVVGGATWAYHAAVLGSRDERDHSEVGRVYDYLLAGAGLVVAASGITMLIATAIKAVSVVTIVTSDGGSTLAAAITLIVVGAPLWWRYWSTIQGSKAADPVGELRSITRRVYIVVLFGVAGIVAVISLIVLVFLVFEDILDSNFGTGTLDGAAVSVALLLTAGALAWYHFTVFREDKADFVPKADDLPVEPDASTVGAVRTVRRGALEQMLEAFAESGHDRTSVMWSKDGFEVEPLDD